MTTVHYKGSFFFFFNFVKSGSETCVSWNFEAGDGYGNWTSEGCVTVNVSNDVVTCQCNHLTNFAILVVSSVYDTTTLFACFFFCCFLCSFAFFLFFLFVLLISGLLLK